MLRISQAYVDAIVAHARRDFPDEACGIIAGPEGSDVAD
ncbi:MAG TPA: Mov34/MPN/PAD-1 family protein, partial [Microlunatus sp.]|nr:Mov34/MPN/PAD-1 family protein [Microlunatus sp.]